MNGSVAFFAMPALQRRTGEYLPIQQEQIGVNRTDRQAGVVHYPGSRRLSAANEARRPPVAWGRRLTCISSRPLRMRIRKIWTSPQSQQAILQRRFERPSWKSHHSPSCTCSYFERLIGTPSARASAACAQASRCVSASIRARSRKANQAVSGRRTVHRRVIAQSTRNDRLASRNSLAARKRKRSPLAHMRHDPRLAFALLLGRRSPPAPPPGSGRHI